MYIIIIISVTITITINIIMISIIIMILLATLGKLFGGISRRASNFMISSKSPTSSDNESRKSGYYLFIHFIIIHSV